MVETGNKGFGKRLVATFVDDTGEMELVWLEVINGLRTVLRLMNLMLFLDGVTGLMVYFPCHIQKWN